jgi:hypothetical protein
LKNKFEIFGDVTVIYLKRKDGNAMKTLIDTCDLKRAQEIQSSWHANYNQHGNWYVKSRIQKNGKEEAVFLHRWLMNASKEDLIDHINHDGLDNRRSVNLRTATPSENQQNRRGSNKNNKSGIRGVSFDKSSRKWVAMCCVNYKNHYIGSFGELTDAENAVLAARTRHMPFSDENVISNSQGR